jgi:hypothetical protein
MEREINIRHDVDAKVAELRFVSLSPATAAESAAASGSWQRRGVLQRLVRLDDRSTPMRKVWGA